MHTHTRGFQSGRQAVAAVSHGHHVCWPAASRLIDKQAGMEGQIRDRCWGWGRETWGGGGNCERHWQMMRLQYMACKQNADQPHRAILFIKKEATPSAYRAPCVLEESTCNYCLTAASNKSLYSLCTVLRSSKM